MKPFLKLFAALAAFLVTPVAGWANDNLVVYIECVSTEGAKSQGSGVLVSKAGHVLTAAHVVPEGATCEASIGNNSVRKRSIRRSFVSHKIGREFDILLMEFGRSSGETFSYASVCPVEDALKERDIVAKGFHADTFGAPSSTNGILSNTAISFNGIVETSAMTVSGKSGGPVFLKGTDAIIGIIAGAKFNELGIAQYYGVLASDTVLGVVDVMKGASNCLDPKPVTATPVAAVAELVAEPSAEETVAAMALYREGHKFLDDGDYAAAREAFTESLKLKPDSVEAQYWLAESHLYLGSNEEAVDIYNTLIAQDSLDPEVYAGRGLAYGNMGDFELAVVDLDKSVELNPENENYLIWRAEMFGELGQFDKARDDLQAALQLVPDDEEVILILRELCDGLVECSN